MFRCTSSVVYFCTSLFSFSMSAPFLPMTTPGRAEWIVTRHFLCGRSMTIRDTPAVLELLAQIVADLDVFLQELAVFVLAGVPGQIPGTVDAEAQPGRIDL